MNTKKYTILGTTDEHTACDCCGKADLKDTVAMLDNETGKEVFFGCVCASKMLGVESKEIKVAARKASAQKQAAEQALRDAASKAEDVRWTAFLDAAAGPRIQWKFERIHQIEKLGGHSAARAAYKASVTV